jgi:hypothetical protein
MICFLALEVRYRSNVRVPRRGGKVWNRRNPAVRLAPAKGRSPPNPVVHLCRAKDRFGIRKSHSWSEADQPFRVDVGFWVRL